MKICLLSFVSLDLFISIIHVEGKILGDLGQLILQSAKRLEDG